MAQQLYTVLTPLKTGGKRYAPGDEVELAAAAAKALEAQGVVAAAAAPKAAGKK